METTEDKHWATQYLLDPLTAAEPSQETGPGANHTFDRSNVMNASESSAKGKENASVHVRQLSTSKNHGYPSPPASASPRKAQFSHRQEAFAGHSGPSTPRSSLDRPSSEMPTSSAGGRRRASSLNERFPGDRTQRPLDIIKRENKAANRAPHLHKRHLVGPDSIDKLDTINSAYHHDGPYDATLLARNTSYTNSPIEAVRATTEEALKATPKEKVMDSVNRHRPLDGVAMVPPGMTDHDGRTYNYEEGPNMMIEHGGDYKRWPGVEYLPEDVKGKGEPSYSIEKALKGHRRGASDSNYAIEMESRPRRSDSGVRPVSNEQSYSQWENDMRRRSTTGRSSNGGGLIKRFGSLRKRAAS